MTKRSRLIVIVMRAAFLLFALTLCACSSSIQESDRAEPVVNSPPPTIALTPTAKVVPTISGSEWMLLTYGDWRTADGIWPEKYAQYLEQDLGVTIQARNRGVFAETSEQLLKKLQLMERERENIRQAEIITVWTMDSAGRDIFILGNFMNECDSLTYRSTLDAIVAEILAIHGQNPLIIRLIDHFNPEKETETNFKQIKSCYEQYNESVHAVAEKYGIAVAPVYEAFNGPDGTESPEDKGYLSNGGWVSNDGDELITSLLRDLGYDPTMP